MLILTLLACATVHPVPEGAVLAPCPSSPNCVSTQAPRDDAVHYVAPVPFSGSLDEVAVVVRDELGCDLLHSGPDYLHGSCTTRSGLFTDDLHVLLSDGRLHVRSASRLGYGDLGVNRRRVGRLVELLVRD